MISLNNITLYFGGFTLFKEVSFLINPTDKVGLVGKNGAGKTTLLKLILGEMSPSEGSISKPGSIRIGYLPQQLNCKDGKTVIDETKKAFSEILDLQEIIAKYTHEISERTDYESEEYLSVITKLNEANDRFALLGGHNMQAETEQTLLGLGFLHSDFNRQTSEFSGGWRMRIELAKILLQKPDVFLLDEPTNHLDIESIQWLETFLTNYNGAVLLISHDRAFLDNVTKRTVEISLGKTYDYRVPYSEYVVLRKEQRGIQMASYQNQQKMIDDTERFIERFRYKASKAVQVQSRIKQLDKIDRIEVDEEDKSSIHFRFPPAPRSGTIVVETENLVKKYGEKCILNNINFIAERGEKIAFVGKNGEGKTTLSRIIVGDLNHEGILKIGYNTQIGYYAQNQPDLLDENKTVFETIDYVAVGEIRTKIRDILGSFLFTGEDIDKKVKVLSGGERSRLSLAKLLLEPKNLLVLDEPTNHLDMKSKDILKQALIKYDGTLILVSHDRDFLDGLITKVYEFRDKNIKQYIGGIYDFLRKKKLNSLKELEIKNQQAQFKEKEQSSANKIQYEEKKEQERELRKISNQISKSEERINVLETELEKINELLANPDKNNIADYNELFSKYESSKKEIDEEMRNWENLHLSFEEFKKT
ncbi:MAG: glycosyl transferase family 2 [Bacteroidetes bacterium RIFOXYA12_FULL_35_11]|nr:MAG: glycosyl transferase family 2 [Bacteroidetes bacterium GWF2_35_48]OFY81943.1 MAG: glycosyl transferase family 2 [Bacteroidetes bacterium RIFOXYA12_FULL_35_11]OFY95487.1 MAG: glycosyl transferase family 2 [Bacteroidetes bacterium RIFOXYC12_FULL_35_7]HBX52209.1 glycosyl transferase family 2 [Bacteroidales bacterium]